MNNQRIAILGAGSMGTAILAGLLRSGIEAGNISVSTKTAATAARLAEEFGVSSFATENTTDANALSVEAANIVLVAVKPAYVLEVLGEVSSAIDPNALVISVAAGITTEAMQAALPESVAVIRSMPNTPAIVGKAVTGLAAGTRANAEQLQQASALFETIGSVLVVGEDQIDQLSTISGSGPAYVFYFIEQFTAAALDMGFPEEQARMMVEQTFLGASELLLASVKTPQELRKQVTSPNGTTMQAIAVFEKANLHELFATATAAALARAKEIAAGN